jgi:hypothetical protein
MSTPILTTKLYLPPPRPNIVLRPRLVERLNESLHCKLTLISAPAGFGKTTLPSAWVVLCDRQVAWLSLDDGDSDPTRFLAYLVAALQTIAVTLGEGCCVCSKPLSHQQLNRFRPPCSMKSPPTQRLSPRPARPERRLQRLLHWRGSRRQRGVQEVEQAAARPADIVGSHSSPLPALTPAALTPSCIHYRCVAQYEHSSPFLKKSAHFVAELLSASDVPWHHGFGTVVAQLQVAGCSD